MEAGAGVRGRGLGVGWWPGRESLVLLSQCACASPCPAARRVRPVIPRRPPHDPARSRVSRGLRAAARVPGRGATIPGMATPCPG